MNSLGFDSSKKKEAPSKELRKTAESLSVLNFGPYFGRLRKGLRGELFAAPTKDKKKDFDKNHSLDYCLETLNPILLNKILNSGYEFAIDENSLAEFAHKLSAHSECKNKSKEIEAIFDALLKHSKAEDMSVFALHLWRLENPLAASVTEACIKNGFDINKQYHRGQNAYILAKKLNLPNYLEYLKLKNASTKEYEVLKITWIFDSPNDFNLSGFSVESRQVLKQYLDEFIKIQPSKEDQAALYKISATFMEEISFNETMDIVEEFEKKLEKGQPFRVSLRLPGHYWTSLVSLEKDKGNLILDMFDRANPFWNPEIHLFPRKLSVVKSLYIRPQKEGQYNTAKLIDFYTLIHAAKNKEELRKLVKEKDWEFLGRAPQRTRQIYQSLPKLGVCHFANQKSLLRYLMLQHFGPKKGVKIYKSYTHFMRQQALHELEKDPKILKYVLSKMPGIEKKFAKFKAKKFRFI